jgi:cupin 2 domain-containing protein
MPGQAAKPSIAGNLRDGLPAALPEELVTVLAGAAGGVRVERIVSFGQASPPGYWYDQEEREFVLVVEGAARLQLEGGELVVMGPGDWIVLDAHQRHRVAWTDPDATTIWLAVFWGV